MFKRDKKEKKEIALYLKLQKAIRIVWIICSVGLIHNLQSSKWTDRLMDFERTVPRGIDMIHGFIFQNHIGETVTTLSQGVVIALGAAIISFVLAWIWQEFDNDVWYKYQNLGLCICGFAGIFYPVASLIIGGGKLDSSGFAITVYVILVIIAIGVAVYNIIKFKDMKDVYASEKRIRKIGPMVLIGIASLGAFIYPIVALADEYKEVREIRQLIESHPEEYQEDIENQMGNYASGKAVSNNGVIYLAEQIRRDEEHYGVYRIDDDGNYDLIWQLEGEGVIDGLAVYDGYIYVEVKIKRFDEEKGNVVNSKIIRISGKTEETVVSVDGLIDFGIVGNKLMYSEQLVSSGEYDEYVSVYTIDLDKELDENNKTLYDKGLHYSYLDSDTWLNIVLYNKYDDYCKYYGCEAQSYQNSVYKISDKNELTRTIYSVSSDDNYYHAIDSNVYAFNIYDGTIFYVKAAEDELYSDTELWCCGMNGEFRRKIGTFPSDSGVENEINFMCNGLYVTDDYVVCDFYRGRDDRRERYWMKIDGGLYKKIY